MIKDVGFIVAFVLLGFVAGFLWAMDSYSDVQQGTGEFRELDNPIMYVPIECFSEDGTQVDLDCAKLQSETPASRIGLEGMASVTKESERGVATIYG